MIGNGNVALDVARVLAKSADEMAKSDIVPEAGAAIAAAPLTDIHVIGRRGPEQASFTNNELAEMGRLARAVAVADPAALDVAPPASDPTPERLRKAKNLEILRGLCQEQAGQQAGHGAFRLQAAPRPQRRSSCTGDFRLVDDLHRLSRRGLPQGRGRLSRSAGPSAGPSGTIPTNRADSHAVAQQVIAWLEGARSQERARPDAADRRRRSRAGTASTRPRSRPVPSSAGLA